MHRRDIPFGDLPFGGAVDASARVGSGSERGVGSELLRVSTPTQNFPFMAVENCTLDPRVTSLRMSTPPQVVFVASSAGEFPASPPAGEPARVPYVVSYGSCYPEC